MGLGKRLIFIQDFKQLYLDDLLEPGYANKLMMDFQLYIHTNSTVCIEKIITLIVKT